MTHSELLYCMGAVISSSIAQLLMKAAAISTYRRKALQRLTASIFLQGISVVLAVLVLRSLALSQLIPFAALAYVLVPLGSCVIFRDRLTPRFWLGAVLIVLGVTWTFI